MKGSAAAFNVGRFHFERRGTISVIRKPCHIDGLETGPFLLDKPISSS
jgi:hypothetical protein